MRKAARSVVTLWAGTDGSAVHAAALRSAAPMSQAAAPPASWDLPAGQTRILLGEARNRESATEA